MHLWASNQPNQQPDLRFWTSVCAVRSQSNDTVTSLHKMSFTWVANGHQLDGYCVQGSSRKGLIHSFWQVLSSIVLYTHTWCLRLTQICSIHWSNKRKKGMSFPKFCFSNLPKFTWTKDVTMKVSHDTFQEWTWYTGYLTSPSPQRQVGVKNHSLQLP